MSKTNFKTIQAVLQVSRKEYITPHYIRIFLTGDQIPLFVNTTVGVNNKIMIPPNGISEIHFPEFDYDAMKWKPQPEDIRPSIRTYTHRGVDLERNEIWIDFVAHGDEGPASAWAINSKEGDNLGVLMKDGFSDLYVKADNYLLVADSTGIPVIAAILEDLSADARGICIIEVHGPEDEQHLKTEADIEFIWLHNSHPQHGSSLANVVKQQSLPTTSRSGYVAAEFATVKDVRQYLRKEKEWKREELYVYSYWKSGVAEDKSTDDRQMEKQND
ncbi:MAG: siderophore-interacting protein [Sphingobacterium sp.]|jgi:NADPH-dependent ferric siderophore reductase|nr:siderophore-interacting protein [Sphingobacterium sp.]